MKTIKSIMIAMLVSFTLVAFSNSQQSITKGSSLKIDPKGADMIENSGHIYVTLQEAASIPGLMDAFFQQQNRNFLFSGLKIITVIVYHQSYAFHISGTYQEWLFVFNPIGVGLGNSDL